MKYYIETTLNTDFESAVAKTKSALSEEGFGVLSEIDIHEKLKEKLDVDFRKYRILGACNPLLAHKALLQEDKIGTMLPCNVIVQQLDERKVEVAAVDPVVSMQRIDNPDFGELAAEVKEKLEKVILTLR